MRIETRLNLTGSGAPFAEALSAELPSVAPLLSERARLESPELATAPAAMEADHWRVDEYWTAVTAYLADLYLPNEG